MPDHSTRLLLKVRDAEDICDYPVSVELEDRVVAGTRCFRACTRSRSRAAPIGEAVEQRVSAGDPSLEVDASDIDQHAVPTTETPRLRDVAARQMEIYKPAYLFNSSGGAATRPSISSAPSSIGWGNTFTVQTPDAANISSVVLVRNGSVTHAFNMDQRLVGMSFTAGTGALTVTAPPNGNIAPPGWYMLFLLNSAGVPSVATFVQLGQTQTQQDFSISATPASQTVSPGSSTAYSVNVTAVGGFAGSTSFTATGLPTGATASFNPTTVTGTGSSTMTVTTSASTPVGSSTLTVKGTSGSLNHQTTVTLTVASGGTTGSLAGSVATPSGTQNLTDSGDGRLGALGNYVGQRVSTIRRE